MTFVRPSTITNQSGAYQFKGTAPSPPQNYIDNQFQNCLDKSVAGDKVSGSIEFLTGSSIVMDTGTIIQTAGGSNVSVGGILNVFGSGAFEVQGSASATITGPLSINGSLSIGSDSIQFTDVGNPITIFHDAASITAGQNMNIEAQNTVASAQSGGNLILQAGSGSGSGGSGGDVEINGGSGTVVSGSILMSGSGVVLSLPTVVFDPTQPTPIITQELLSSGNAQALTIQAQSTLSGNGGRLNLYSGTGTTDDPGFVALGISGTSYFVIGGNASHGGMQYPNFGQIDATGLSTLTCPYDVYVAPSIRIFGTCSTTFTITLPANGISAQWTVECFNVTFSGSGAINFQCGAAGQVTTNQFTAKGCGIVVVGTNNNIGLIQGV